MITAKQLYYQRLKAYLVREEKYYKKIFNNHFVIFLMVCFAAFIYGYKQALIEGIQVNHSIIKIFLFAVFILVTHAGKLFLFFEDADRFFLLGKDELIKQQAKIAVNISFVIQMLIIIAVWSVSLPLMLTIGYHISFTLCLLIVMLLVKYDKLHHFLLIDESKSIKFFALLMIEIDMFISFFNQTIIFGALGLALVNLLYSFIKKNIFRTDIKHLISLEKQRLEKHYAFLSYFVDVKVEQSIIKERKYLNKIINKLNDGLFKLLVIKVVRNKELLPIIVRIILLDIAIQFLMINPNIYMQLALFSLLSWLIISQASAINISLKKSMWVKLTYKNSDVDREQLKFNAICVFLNWLLFSVTLLLLQYKLALVVVSISAIIVVMLLILSYLNMKKINKEI